MINSPVGESECNGRVENAVRRVQEKIRVLRHQLERNIKEPLHNNSPIMAWFVRWATEIISKYAPGDDGRTPFERIMHEKCIVPLVPFGEIVLYLPPKTVRRNKGDVAKREWGMARHHRAYRKIHHRHRAWSHLMPYSYKVTRGKPMEC